MKTKIFLYSHTFGKRVSKLYDIDVIFSIVEKSTEENIFNNVVDFLVEKSKYNVHLRESLTYEFKNL